MRKDAFDGVSVRAPTKVAGTQVIHRVIAILRIIARDRQAGCRISEIASELDLHIATVHRMVLALASEGFVVQNPETKCYRLGEGLFDVVGNTNYPKQIQTQFAPLLHAMAEWTEDTIYLTMRSGNTAICLSRVEGRFPIRTLTLEVGNRRPLGVGAGSLALLAFLDDAEVDRIVAANANIYPQFGVTAEKVKTFVQTSRRLGYSFNDSDILLDMRGVGLPVRDASGEYVIAVSVSAINRRLEEPRRSEIMAHLRECLANMPPIS